MDEQNNQNLENKDAETDVKNTEPEEKEPKKSTTEEKPTSDKNGVEQVVDKVVGFAKKIGKKIKQVPKKVWIISAISLLVVAAAIVTIVIISSLPCSHNYESEITRKASCEYSQLTRHTCTKCDYYYTEATGDKLPHDMQPATCNSASKCKNCTYREGEALSHEYENGSCTTYPTCKHCGAERSYKESHNYEGTTDGTCTVCGTGTKFILPSTPTTISDGSYSRCTVEKITLSRETGYGYVTYKLTFLLKSTYHKNGSSYSDSARFGWKLYDEDGLVVDSGTGYSDAQIKVGEKSKTTITFTIGGSFSYSLDPDKTYTLVLLDIG